MLENNGAPTKGAPQELPIVDIFIELTKNKKKTSDTRYDSRDVQKNILVKSTETPFYSSARALLKKGANSNSVLRMFRKGASECDLVGPITEAAGLIVVDGSRRSPYVDRWKAIS